MTDALSDKKKSLQRETKAVEKEEEKLARRRQKLEQDKEKLQHDQEVWSPSFQKWINIWALKDSMEYLQHNYILTWTAYEPLILCLFCNEWSSVLTKIVEKNEML